MISEFQNSKRLKILILLFAGLLVIDLFLIGYFFVFNHQGQSSNLNNFVGKVIFLDVGQGDAILIQTAAQQNILIDGGPTRQIIYKLDQYLPLNHRQIDLMILTHPDPDHLNGLVEVLKHYPVNQVYSNGVSDPDLNYLAWQKIIADKHIPLHFVIHPEKLQIDQQMRLDFLWPQESLVGQNLKDDNLGSIVAELVDNNYKFLFTGDIPAAIENQLIKDNPDFKIDVLKVSHHGSKYSTSLSFLENIKPRYAVISVGSNKFGHPSVRVLHNLEKLHIPVLRTDQQGDIMFFSDGQNLSLKTTK